MNLKRWIARRESSWRRLEDLLAHVDRSGLRHLNSEQVKELASLYRSVTADLARARTHQVGDSLIQSLQTLTSRAYGHIYQGDRHQNWRQLYRFYQQDLPNIVQETWGYTALATGIFSLGALISWWYAWKDPSFLERVVPYDLISLVRDEGKLWMGSILGEEPLASSNIMINNLSVAFRVVGGGVSLGLISTYILFLNGVLIGAIACLVSQNHLAIPFWAFVMPHGVLELPAIFLAGGAGLLLARAILFPGSYHRRDALRHYGQKAAQLLYGIIPLLIIAGTIEGFFSPSPLIPDPLKYGVGFGLLGLLIRYLTGSNDRGSKLLRRPPPGTLKLSDS